MGLKMKKRKKKKKSQKKSRYLEKSNKILCYNDAMLCFCLQVPECFFGQFSLNQCCFFCEKKIKKVEIDRDILLPHSDNMRGFKMS